MLIHKQAGLCACMETQPIPIVYIYSRLTEMLHYISNARFRQIDEFCSGIRKMALW